MYIGVDVQESRISIGLVNDQGKINFRNSFPVEAQKSDDAILTEIIFIIKSMTETIPLELFNQRPLGIGLSIADELDKNSGYLRARASRELLGQTQQEKFQRHFNLPVYIENHGKAKELAIKETANSDEASAGVIAAALLCKYLT